MGQKFVLQMSREFGRCIYLTKIALVNYQYLEVVTMFLYGEYRLKTLEVRKATEELIKYRNKQLSRESEVEKGTRERGLEDLNQDIHKLKAQIKGQNASLLRMNQQLLVWLSG